LRQFGQVVLPPILKKAVDIKSDVVVAGVLNKIEIWPADRYEADLKAILDGDDRECDLAKMSEEAFALLEEEDVCDRAKE
jgi:MraZ protein